MDPIPATQATNKQGKRQSWVNQSNKCTKTTSQCLCCKACEAHLFNPMFSHWIKAKFSNNNDWGNEIEPWGKYYDCWRKWTKFNSQRWQSQHSRTHNNTNDQTNSTPEALPLRSFIRNLILGGVVNIVSIVCIILGWWGSECYCIAGCKVCGDRSIGAIGYENKSYSGLITCLKIGYMSNKMHCAIDFWTCERLVAEEYWLGE